MTRCVRLPTTVVGIPVRDEADRIQACLEALDEQIGAQLDHIVLLLNNCTDDTAAVVRGVQLRPGTRLHCLERTLSPAVASAGHARRLAMAAASALAGPGGVLLTTDADGRVDPDWLAANLAAIAAGADAVAGWVELDPIEWGQIPAHLHEDDARECAYDRLCDEIHALLDPDPADPLPRHTQNSGASIAVTMAAYTLSGGVPDIPSGEDRAFIAALRRAGAKIRHAPEVHVMVSGRTVGRSVGGMADTIRRRLDKQDEHIDDRLEPAVDCARRASLRGQLRAAFGQRALSALPYLPPLSSVLPFETAWDAVEPLAMPDRRVVRVADLAEQTAAAEMILGAIQRCQFEPAGRSDTAPPVLVGLPQGRSLR